MVTSEHEERRPTRGVGVQYAPRHPVGHFRVNFAATLNHEQEFVSGGNVGLLSGYRVVDLCDSRGMLASRILADLGATVILVEPAGGSSARNASPSIEDSQGNHTSLPFEFLGSNKRSVVLDADNPADLETLRALLDTADFVFTTQSQSWLAARNLDFESVAKSNPWAVYTSITPYGATGPKADWAASELTCWASGGPLFFNRDEDLPPVRISIPQAWSHAAADGAAAAMIAHRARLRDGVGQFVDVSAQASAAMATLSAVLSAAVGDRATYPVEGTPEEEERRKRLDLSGSGSASRRTKWKVLDGFVELHLSLGPAAGRFTNNLMAWLKEEGAIDEDLSALDWVEVPDLYKAGTVSFDDLERARNQVAAFFGAHTKEQLMAAAVERKILLAPIATTQDLLDSEHLEARHFFRTVTTSAGVSVTMPGSFAYLDGEPVGERGPAPVLNEGAEFLNDLSATPRRSQAATELPALDGLKVADLSWVVAGPAIGRVLADYGATVVRAESSWRVETNRLVGPFVGGVQGPENSASYSNCNTNKLGMTLDLSTEQGRDVVRDLVAWADVVIESFSPGVMDRWGLSFDELTKINPKVIMLSTSLMGQFGPLANFAGYGNMGAAISGFQQIVGWPERPPLGPFGPYTDYVGPRFGLVMLMAALERRDREGRAAHIDLAQVEAALQFIAAEISECALTGEVAQRRGNADRVFAPHGVYSGRLGTEGNSRWLAIAIETDQQWGELAKLLELDSESRFDSVRGRRDHEAEIDEAIRAWLRDQDVFEAEARLQSRGIPAQVALSSLDMLGDEQLKHREHFVEIDHPIHGTTTVENSRFILSRTPARIMRCAPTFGRDNDVILREILGYEDEHIEKLREGNILR